MRAYLLTASFRVHFLISLVITSAFVIPTAWLPVVSTRTGPVDRLIPSLIPVLVSVWFATRSSIDDRDRLLEMTGLDDPAARWAALLAAVEGRVPEDPRIAEAAHRIALDRVAEGRRLKARRLGAMAVFVLIVGLLAVARSPWWAVYAVLIVVAAGLVLRRGRRWKQRAELLGGRGTSSVPGGEDVEG